MTPFRKRCKTSDFTFSFNDGYRTIIKNASKFLLVHLSFGAGIRTSNAKQLTKQLQVLGLLKNKFITK